jgi:hypothetical protein
VITTGIRQQQTAATTLPPGARHHPASTLRRAQMTSIDLLATRSHVRAHGSARLRPQIPDLTIRLVLYDWVFTRN